MNMVNSIVELLQQTPGMNSNQIAEKINGKKSSVKVTLTKLVKLEKVVREKMPKVSEEKFAGPKNLYCYKVKQ